MSYSIYRGLWRSNSRPFMIVAEKGAYPWKDTETGGICTIGLIAESRAHKMIKTDHPSTCAQGSSRWSISINQPNN